MANVYNNANKIANLFKGRPIGCVTFGSGSIGNASISTLLKDFRTKLSDPQYFEPNNYTMESVATQLVQFLETENKKQPAGAPRPTLGIFLGGYSTGSRLGERWALSVADGKAQSPKRLHQLEEVGINWGGEGGEAISRLILGYGGALPNIVRNVVKPSRPPIS